MNRRYCPPHLRRSSKYSNFYANKKRIIENKPKNKNSYVPPHLRKEKIAKTTELVSPPKQKIFELKTQSNGKNITQIAKNTEEEILKKENELNKILEIKKKNIISQDDYDFLPEEDKKLYEINCEILSEDGTVKFTYKKKKIIQYSPVFKRKLISMTYDSENDTEYSDYEYYHLDLNEKDEDEDEDEDEIFEEEEDEDKDEDEDEDESDTDNSGEWNSKFYYK